MPSGKTHDLIAFITSAAAAPTIYYRVPPEWHGFSFLALAAYLWGSLYLSDDLDLDSRAYRRWGLLRFLWWPYQKALPHRSWLSHGVAVGPFLRVVYFITVLFVVWMVVAPLLRLAGLETRASASEWYEAGYQFVKTHQREVMACLFGFFLAGLVHTVADTISTGFKKAF